MPELEYTQMPENYYDGAVPEGVRPHFPLELNEKGEPTSYRFSMAPDYSLLNRVAEITENMSVDQRARRAESQWRSVHCEVL